MKSYITSYNGLFSRVVPDTPVVERIEIPLFQRDYAQGREAESVKRIRTGFLEVLHGAATGGAHVNLDFVFGDVLDGTLRPLDGQQRLTTLFLLHWYLAFRADRLEACPQWKNFSYATRASARLFCTRLTTSRPPADVSVLSTWIKDQSWYLHTWRHDPTIESMLVMLDATHDRFRDDDCSAAWNRLVDPADPAITFHLLPIEQMGSSEDLYVKMNSRGKPLTPFENFKAVFVQMLEVSSSETAQRFASRADIDWTDFLWDYRGNHSIIDDEFLRYFRFVAEVCDWRNGGGGEGELEVLARRVFDGSTEGAVQSIDFMFQAFDTWIKADIRGHFAGLFTETSAPPGSTATSKVRLFGPPGGIRIDLFEACCSDYGKVRGRNRVFAWAETLLLYAVLLQRIYQTPDLPRRLRTLRNLVEASGNELRQEKMPALIEDVRRIVVDGTLDGVTAFNQGQVADEKQKAEFVAKNPRLDGCLYGLEDHPILHGCLAAFELDPAVFEARATAFHQLLGHPELWPALTGALLATGEYHRRMNSRAFLFGSGSNPAPWKELLTGAGRSELASTRRVLGSVLDHVAQARNDPGAALASIRKNWLDATDPGKGLGWRWYLVNYPVMRTGGSGIYVGSGGSLGYDVCMLNRRQMNSWYRDPFLLAIHQLSGVGTGVEDPWFTGYETEPRYLRLAKSGTGLRCVDSGFAILPPLAAVHLTSLRNVCQAHGVGADNQLRVPQADCDGARLDVQDRVKIGAALVLDLVDAGL